MERQEFDEAYVERLCGGDAQTEAHFCRYFGQLLGLKLRARLRQPQQIEDVRQETFARVFSILRREGVRHPERLGALVNSVCNNILLESYRSIARDGAQSELPENLAAREMNPGDRIDQERRAVQVREVLRRLPDRDRSILTALFLEDADKDEICRRFSVDRDYLRVLVFRAKQVFRAKFKTA